MSYNLSGKEQKAMEKTISQIAKKHGVTEAEVRRDITELIVESMKNAQADPVARELWKCCPCAGDIPTPEEFIFWTSCRVLDGMEQDGLKIREVNTK